jgi:hypothetical protein
LTDSCADLEAEFLPFVAQYRSDETWQHRVDPYVLAHHLEPVRGVDWRLIDGRNRSAKSWPAARERVIADANAGAIDRVAVSLCDGPVLVEWSRVSVDVPGCGDIVRFHINVGLEVDDRADVLWFPLDALDPWELLARRFVRTIAPNAGASAAFATVDTARVPYVKWMGGSETGPAFRQSAYGFYWANLVGREAVRRLGGLERVMQEAPGTPEPVGDGSVYIELAPRPWDVTDAQLAQLRDFLYPVLPPRPEEFDRPGRPAIYDRAPDAT